MLPDIEIFIKIIYRFCSCCELLRQKGQPLGGLSLSVLGQKIRKRRFEWLLFQVQPHLFGSFVSFLDIASIAGSDEIGPRGFTSFGSGDDMVKGELSATATVLTCTSIPSEKIGTIEHHSSVGDIFVLVETDDCGIIEVLGDSSDFEKLVTSNDDCLLEQQQDDGFLWGHHCHGSMI
jgi:hypothetical protein